MHDVPTLTQPGSYSRALDEAVGKGAAYYLLYREALQDLRKVIPLSLDIDGLNIARFR